MTPASDTEAALRVDDLTVASMVFTHADDTTPAVVEHDGQRLPATYAAPGRCGSSPTAVWGRTDPSRWWWSSAFGRLRSAWWRSMTS